MSADTVPRSHSPPRPDAGAVVAVRAPASRRSRAICWKAIPSLEPLGQRHHARRAAAARSTACTIISSTQREFERLRDSDALLEWAEVHGNFYGTPREPVEAAMAEGRDMLFDIDWQGAQQLKEKMRADIVSIFILPPSMTRTEGAAEAPRRGSATR